MSSAIGFLNGGVAGAGIGAGIGIASSLIGLSSQNKAVISQVKREGELLASNMRQININRELIDRDLGDVLSANALATAKNMATAKVLMSTSGTIGGTTSQVSKQAYMEQILSDADLIKEARNRQQGQLTDAVSKSMNYRLQANAIRSSIKSPMEALFGTITSAITGGIQGAQIGTSFGSNNSVGFVGDTGVVSGGTAQSRMDFRNANFNNYLMRQG